MKKGLSRTAISATVLLLAAISAGDADACLYDKCFDAAYGFYHNNIITKNQEEHGYSFNALLFDVVIIRAVHPDNTFNPYLEIISPQGYLVASAGVPGTGMAEIVTGRLDPEGTYTIVVSDLAGNGRGEYHLSVQSSNRPGNPALLQIDQTITDTLYNLSQLQAYQFMAEAGEIIDIQMIEITAAMEPHIRLYDPEGRLLASSAHYQKASIFNRILDSAGLYTIIADDNNGDDTGIYYLVLGEGPLDVDNEPGSVLPQDFVLYQNHPNPFNPETTIGFNLSRTAVVNIDIFNILGEHVRALVSAKMTPGTHSIRWDGRNENGADAPSGIYFYRLSAEGFSETRKMLLLR